MSKYNILTGNVYDMIPKLKNNSIQSIITSPPYWGLRDYGSPDQIGLEDTVEEYVANLVKIFDQLKPKLKDNGTLWLNLGDTYSNHKDSKSVIQTLAKGTPKEKTHEIAIGRSVSRNAKLLKAQGLKNKDLIGIPWRVALALQANGWYLRQDIIWSKPNPMPESVKDRCSKSHEHVFLLTKSDKYYFDYKAIREPVSEATVKRLSQKNLDQQEGSSRVPFKKNGNMKAVGNLDLRNKRDVWNIATKPFKGAHFAVMPEELVLPCLLAGSKEGDIVFDPFTGSGTVGVVAKKNKRKFIGIEINTDYVEIAKERIKNTNG